MKQNATNVWKDGLNKDLNPMNTPNTVLTDNLNGTFVTYNGNELSLQNDMGNVFTTKLSNGFFPIGLTEFGDIIYIVSISDSCTERAFATLVDGASEIDAINTIIALCAEQTCKFTQEELEPLFESEGMPIYNPLKRRILNEVLWEVSEIASHHIDCIPSKKLEIGSFPSLDPSNLVNNPELELDFEDKYRPFHNLLIEGKPYPFSTTALNEHGEYDIEHPVSIEVQPSYDGSVNLILIDDKNPPRIINSGFAALKNGKGKFINRHQTTKTNYYIPETIDKTTRLINFSNDFTRVELEEYDPSKSEKQPGVQPGGQLKGGNYTFYFKFGDEDGNKTDIICESGIVSIFKGTTTEPRSVSGAFHNEVTDKLVHLTLYDLDTNYSRLYVYYTREYCDLNGFRLVECKEIVEPYKISGEIQTITVSGIEVVQEISIEELNIAYYSISSAKAIAQQQSMLFLGNVSTSSPDSKELQNISLKIEVGVEQDSTIGSINTWNYEYDEKTGREYYDPQNIYYKLGYWPDELYRFGIVYIKKDGTNTQVFNLKGCRFDALGESNMSGGHDIWTSEQQIQHYPFFENTDRLDNIAGVFKTPDVNILIEGQTRPLYFTFKLNEFVINKLKDQGIIGYFIVRQKRIPITICQGFGIGVDKNTYIPMIQKSGGYHAESFVTGNLYDVETEDKYNRRLTYENISISGDVVSKTTEPGVFYICEEKWTTWLFWTWVKYSVIGPKGENPDCCLFTSSDALANNWSPAFNQCLDYCDKHSISLVSREIEDVKHTKTYNTNYVVNPDGINDKPVSEIEEIYPRERTITSSQENGGGIISVDAMVNPEIQSMLCGTKFTLDPINECDIKRNSLMFYALGYNTTSLNSTDAKLIYIPEGTPLKYIDNVGFSTQIGDGLNPSSFGFLENKDSENSPTADKIVRGQFTPFIGVISESSAQNVIPNYLYNIRIPHDSEYKADVRTRANDSSEYYAVSNKLSINAEQIESETGKFIGTHVFRGDCFTNTVTVRMHRNFIDSTAPITDKIVKPKAWHDYYWGYNKTVPADWDKDHEHYWERTHWEEINISDLNTVSLGHWLTYKCLSSSNLGLRSEDTSNVSEMALMGNPRSFYPLVGASTSTGMKLEESHLLNTGYNATVGRKRHTLKQNTPFDKSDFSNRIMFSNVNVSDSFTNGYRTFQGASYQDYTKQYGSIVKLLPWGNNLFCVFEHGIAIIPINEKALMQTTTEQTIHIYGHGVLPEQLTIVSQDFGTLWPESVVRTPIGIYGIDTVAKKIWKFTDENGLETISDLKLQRFLNDNINLGLNKQTVIGATNVKTHYNAYKGDVMFTFYNDGLEWNLCYNERQALWVTRYDWTPMFSGNINNTYYSIQKYNWNQKDYLQYGRLYKHGRTGIDTQFYPTMWYSEQKPFEFEFVVNDPAGVHKIFEDLMIISNNVQPEEIEFEFIGDDYLFNKARLYHDGYNVYGNRGEDRPYRTDITKYTKENYNVSNFKPLFYNAEVAYDKVLDTYTLVVKQVCKNVETYGRRLGNIQYKEDGWYTNIEPLRYNANLKNPNITTFSELDKFVSAKLRDKWVRIRIKYKGDRLAIVNGVTTFENISYS